MPLHAEGAVLRALIAPRTPRPIDIARTAGVSRQFVNDVLSGRRRPSARVLDACEQLGLPVDDLFRPAHVQAKREPEPV